MINMISSTRKKHTIYRNPWGEIGLVSENNHTIVNSPVEKNSIYAG